MAFQSGVSNGIRPVGAGEQIALVVATPYTQFEDGLKIGRFAKYNAGVAENVVGTADDIIVAGVVLRDIGGAIESGDEVKADYAALANVAEAGLVTVEVVAGITPNKFDKVYVYKNTDVATSEWGKATNHASDNDSAGTAVNNAPVDAYFYEEVADGVWTIRIK